MACRERLVRGEKEGRWRKRWPQNSSVHTGLGEHRSLGCRGEGGAGQLVSRAGAEAIGVNEMFD